VRRGKSGNTLLSKWWKALLCLAILRLQNRKLERDPMRLGIAVCRVILAVFVITGSTSSAHTLAGLPAGFRPVLFQGTPSFSTTPPSPIDLGPSAVGMTTPHAAALPVQFNNPGTATLSISSFSFSSIEAAFTSESALVLGPPLTVSVGSFQSGNVLFTPQAAGPRTVQLTFNDNAPGSPHVVQFTGTGVPVAANDIGLILDPGTASTVAVSAGGSATFPIWILSGASATNFNVSVQCSGGPTGTACSLSDNSPLLTGDGFGFTREKIMVTVSVPAKSALSLHRTRPFWWAAAFIFGILFVWKNGGNVRRFAAIAVLLITNVFIISCGGSSTTGVTGSSSLVITATRSPGTPHSLTVPLVVQ
jgi:hypothetical protein